MTRFQDAFGPEGARIAVHIPFYPACNFEPVGDLEVSRPRSAPSMAPTTTGRWRPPAEAISIVWQGPGAME
jgi:hypothetical protein